MLTSAEKKIATDFWANIQTDLKSNSVNFMLLFFEQHPQYQKLFKGFDTVPQDKLIENKRFTGHSFFVLNAVNGIILNLMDQEILTDLVIKIGKNHKVHQLTKRDMDNVRITLMDYFRLNFKKEFTPDVESVWEKLLRETVDTLGKGLEEAD